MLLVVLCGFVLNVTWNAGQAVLGYATNVSPTSLLQETNIQRSQNGKGALSLNSQLAQAAQAKANDMAARDYWSHATPEGKQPWQFISQYGYTYTTAGENLAYGFDNSSATVAGWMNSPSHRDNLLSSNYLDVGFGIANSANYQGTSEETIIVAMYAKSQKVVTPSTVQNGRAPDAPVQKKAETPTPAPAPAAAAEPTPTSVAEPPVTEEPKKQTTTPVNNLNTEDLSRNIPVREVSRIDVLTNGNAQWAALALSVLATVVAISFILRHARLWRKYLVRGEDFIIKHPLLDTVFVAVSVLGFLLTRTSGFIQ